MNERTVAIYARVSTEHEAQLSALENQVQYYDNILSSHPDWTLYKQYIDEGITGTSTKKRKQFMRMMEDAENGCFDLIITREVSRFARNTVDTLQETRKLKRIGVEVWFTEDNIWTMNDEDGELRLTIMATLAQNESKKTSLRVKAGQMVSFQNGVAYGNGNILGYDKVGNDFIINQEQAETVKRIFELYLDGNGVRKIQFALEKEGRLTATGRTNWQSAVISHILKNPFYCGTVVYRKQYVPDYLEQKKINNHGNVEQVVVQGRHEPIISKEDFDRVQKLLKKHSRPIERGRMGVKVPVNIWSKKLRCCCGHDFNRKVWHRSKDGTSVSFAYQCYSSIRTGTIGTRLNKGLSIEGICDVPMIQEWKLYAAAKLVFDSFWKDRQRVIEIANKYLEEGLADGDPNDHFDELKGLEAKKKQLLKKIDNLVDLRLAEEVDLVYYKEKKTKLDESLNSVIEKIDELKRSFVASEDDADSKLRVLKYALEKNFQFESDNIPDEILDAFIDKVIVYKDRFEFYLNFTEKGISCLVDGKKNKHQAKLMDTFPTDCDSSTGGDFGRKIITGKREGR